MAIAQQIELAPSETRVGLFAVQIETLGMKNFMLMRKLLPRKEYTLAKNRLSSRISRRKNKDTLVALKEKNLALLRKNCKLRRLLAEKTQPVPGPCFIQI